MLRVVPDVWGAQLGCGLRFAQWRRTRNLVKSETPLVYGEIESPNTSSQAIKLDQSCSGQAHSNKPGTGPGYENTELECVLALLRVPPIICPLRSTDAKHGKVV